MRHRGRGVLAALGLAVAVLSVAGVARGEPPGDAARGRETFTAKECARCHVPRAQSGVGPALEQLRRPQGAFALAGRLWNHAPGMFTVLKIENLQWPQISAGEMADLMTYLEADPARDPAPDLSKGQLMLLRKGCLKCHSLRGEGGRLAPDLSAQRASYESAVAWAARMWQHTPAMAAKAMEVGVLYPRFAEDEMLNLVAFLRSSAK
ncbi:MAG TPA: c-type cytochrome [Candidatus Acidoferrum sp.]|nr:c-type cytochrome [Candidatus Acidoferrum sp.]